MAMTAPPTMSSCLANLRTIIRALVRKPAGADAVN
jgi:hypothetical protein